MRNQPSQTSLFEDEAAGGTAIVRVGVVGSPKTLTRAQKTFNRLSGQIEDRRRRLADWQAFTESFRSRVAGELMTLERRISELRRELLKCFDAAHDGGRLTRREQDKIAWIIRESASELLAAGDDPELITLHDKYSEVSHEDLREEEADFLKSLTEATLGMSFDDDEIRSPEDVVDAIHRKFEKEAAPDGRGGPDASETSGRPAGGARRGRRQGGGEKPASARAGARFERERAAVEAATRSVREVYRKLVSALHPDRERDPVERERKTALMQRANQAYEATDLLQLLALQIEAEQIDLHQLAAVNDDRLAHFNRVLKEQLAELDQEIDQQVMPFAMSMGGMAPRNLTPTIVASAFERDVAQLRRERKSLEKQLDASRDPGALKAWLKKQRVVREPAPDPFDPLDPFGPLDELDGLMAALAEAIDQDPDFAPDFRPGPRPGSPPRRPGKKRKPKRR